MKNSKFKPQQSPTYYPKPTTGPQRHLNSVANTWLAASGFSPRDGSPKAGSNRRHGAKMPLVTPSATCRVCGSYALDGVCILDSTHESEC